MHFVMTVQYVLGGNVHSFTNDDLVDASPGVTRQAQYHTALERTRQALAFKREHRVATTDLTVLYFDLGANYIR